MKIMQYHFKKYQFFNKALLSITVSMIALIFIFFMWYSYNHNIKHAEKEKLANLQSIAKSITLMIDGDMHEQLTCNHTSQDEITSNNQNTTYLAIHSLLKKAQKINGLESPIYTLFKNNLCGKDFDEPKILMGITSTTPFYRHLFLKTPECLHDYFETGSIVEQYSTENGEWLSAFHPIKNSQGKTVAVVQIDEQFDSFIKMAQQKLIKESLLLFLFLALLSIGFIFIYRWFFPL